MPIEMSTESCLQEKAENLVVKHIGEIQSNIKTELKEQLNQFEWQNAFRIAGFKNYVQVLNFISNKGEHHQKIHYYLIYTLLSAISSNTYNQAKEIYLDDIGLMYELVLTLPGCDFGEEIHELKRAKEANNLISKSLNKVNLSSTSTHIESQKINQMIKELQEFIEEGLQKVHEADLWNLYRHCMDSMKAVKIRFKEGNSQAEKPELDEVMLAESFRWKETDVVDQILYFLTKGEIAEPSRILLKYEKMDHEFLFLRHNRSIMKPNYLFNYKGSPILIGDFKVAQCTGATFENDIFLRQMLSYNLCSNLSNNFITNGKETLFYFIPSNVKVQRVLNRTEQDPVFEMRIEYIKIEEIKNSLKNSRRDIKHRLTNRLFIAATVVDNYLTLTENCGGHEQKSMSLSVKKVLKSIKKSDQEIKEIIDSMRNQYHIVDIYGQVSQKLLLTKAIQARVKQLDINNDFSYHMKSDDGLSLVVTTEVSELKKNKSYSSCQLSDLQKIVTLKIYDYLKLEDSFGNESTIDKWWSNIDDPQSYIDYIFQNQFLTEIVCLEKIHQYNSNCKEQHTINSPELYFYGYIKTEEFCGFYLCMEHLEFIEQKPKSQSGIDLGLIQLQRLYSIGIIHNDVKLSNVCFDEKSQKIYLLDFGISILLQDEEVEPLDSVADFSAMEIDVKDRHLNINIQNMKDLLDESK